MRTRKKTELWAEVVFIAAVCLALLFVARERRRYDSLPQHPPAGPLAVQPPAPVERHDRALSSSGAASASPHLGISVSTIDMGCLETGHKPLSAPKVNRFVRLTGRLCSKVETTSVETKDAKGTINIRTFYDAQMRTFTTTYFEAYTDEILLEVTLLAHGKKTEARVITIIKN